MVYTAITPEAPGLLDSFLGSQGSDSPVVPQLPFVRTQSSTFLATALLYNALSPAVAAHNQAVAKQELYNVLATPALRLRGTAPTDQEVFVTAWSFAQETPLVLAEGTPQGLSLDQLGSLPWERYGRFVGSTSLFVFQGVPTPVGSQVVWDGRWPLVISESCVEQPVVDWVPVLRQRAQAALENPELQPSQTVGLQGLVSSASAPDPAVGKQAYDRVLVRFLSDNYSARAIPPSPRSFEELLATRVLVQAQSLPTSDPSGEEPNAPPPPTRLPGGEEDYSAEIQPFGTTNLVFRGTVADLFGSAGLPVLSAFYLSTGDPALEPLITDLQDPAFSVVLPDGLVGSIAALVVSQGGEDLAYFKEWVFFVRPVELRQDTANYTY